MSTAPDPDEAVRWRKRLAAQANNRAWALAEAASRTPADDAEMLQAAHAAAHLWQTVGQPGNQAHAAQLLAHVYALLRQPVPARQHLRQSQPFFLDQPSAPWEQAFAHAVAANVAHAEGDRAGHARHLQAARALVAALDDPEDRAILERTLAVIPPPAAPGAGTATAADTLATALPGCTLRRWADGDQAALQRLADNRRVWRNMADSFPHPYTAADADGWIVAANLPRASVHRAVVVGGELAGGVGAIAGSAERRASADFGYWIGAPFWGRGIASAAATALADHLLAQRLFARLEARVYAWNPASARVLEKAGFTREALLRDSITKDGCLIDSWLYARIAR